MGRITAIKLALLCSGGFILSFGLYNIHHQSALTEGGILGMTLLLEHWLGVSPAYSGFVMDAGCFFLGWRMLGTRFLACSMVGSASFAVSYRLWEQFPPLLPSLVDRPLLAAVVGALFVGVGVGLAVGMGGAAGGDDVLAVVISRRWGLKIGKVYLVTDLIVLVLSLSYLSPVRIGFSVVTACISGWLIGKVSTVQLPKNKWHKGFK